MGLFDKGGKFDRTIGGLQKTTKKRLKKVKKLARDKPFTPKGISVNEPLVTRRSKKVRPLF